MYRCWFAGNDQVFEEQFPIVQDALQYVDDRLAQSSFLCGNQITLADIRAFAHLFRYDVIYYHLMLRDQGAHMADFPHIMGWAKHLFNNHRVQETCDLQLATRFYLMPQVNAEDCDKRYTACRYEWMPSITDLEEKRKSEQLESYMLAVFGG